MFDIFFLFNLISFVAVPTISNWNTKYRVSTNATVIMKHLALLHLKRVFYVFFKDKNYFIIIKTYLCMYVHMYVCINIFGHIAKADSQPVSVQ